MPKSDERDIQDRVSSLYEEVRYQKPYSRLYHLWWTRMMLASAPPGGLWLDVGCGTGWLSAAQDQIGGKRTLMGIDISHGMLVRAREKGLAVAEADLLDLPFQDSLFDVVHAKGVLHHVDDFDRSLREIRRVLKPGGVVLLADPNAGPLRRLEEFIAHKDEHFSDTHRSHSAPAYRKSLESEFDLLSFKYFGFLAYPLCVPDIFDIGRFLPAPTSLTKLLIHLDQLISRIPLLNRCSWAFFAVARKPMV